MGTSWSALPQEAEQGPHQQVHQSSTCNSRPACPLHMLLAPAGHHGQPVMICCCCCGQGQPPASTTAEGRPASKGVSLALTPLLKMFKATCSHHKLCCALPPRRLLPCCPARLMLLPLVPTRQHSSKRHTSLPTNRCVADACSFQQQQPAVTFQTHVCWHRFPACRRQKHRLMQPTP
jgi:hypothetical protein